MSPRKPVPRYIAGVESIKMQKHEIAKELVRGRLDFDPKTGIFTWATPSCRRIRAGASAGSVNAQGYVRIWVDYKNYAAHQLAWLHFYGEWPSRSLDHINGDRADNRISNLRLCTPTENGWNAKVAKNNKLGIKGVSYCPKRRKYQATMWAPGRKKVFLGRFDSAEAASRAYNEAAILARGQFARVNAQRAA